MPRCFLLSTLLGVLHLSFCFLRTLGEPADHSNYGTISPLPVLGKVFKAIINVELVKHLTTYDHLSGKQYGFRFNRSTTDVLTAISEGICQALDKNGKVRIMALDISIELGILAFDAISRATVSLDV